MVRRTSELHYFPLVLKSETGFHETTRLTSNVESSCLTLPGSWDLYVRHSQRRLEHRIHFESWKAKGQAWQQKQRESHITEGTSIRISVSGTRPSAMGAEANWRTSRFPKAGLSTAGTQPASNLWSDCKFILGRHKNRFSGLQPQA